MSPQTLERARATLSGARLIAYEHPLYQVLALDPPTPPRDPGLRSAQAALARLPAHLQRRAPIVLIEGKSFRAKDQVEI